MSNKRLLVVDFGVDGLELFKKDGNLEAVGGGESVEGEGFGGCGHCWRKECGDLASFECLLYIGGKGNS
jgi:hypothetical protein